MGTSDCFTGGVSAVKIYLFFSCFVPRGFECQVLPGILYAMLYVLFLLILLITCFAHLQVRKVLSQTIITMAHHGYLEIEGGQLMIDFIVRQCALPSDTVSCRHSVDNVAVVCVHKPCTISQ